MIQLGKAGIEKISIGKFEIKKINLCDIFLFLYACAQMLLIMVNAFIPSKTLNYALYVHSYVIIFSIIVSLFIKGVVKHYLAFAFFVCFMIFLMGQKLFLGDYNVFLTFVRTQLNAKEYFTFISIISIAEIFTYYAYLYFYDKPKKQPLTYGVPENKSMLPMIRILYFATLPFAAYMQMKIVIVKSSLQYTDGYLVNVSIPTVVKIAYYIFVATTMMYLAIKPSKKETFLVIGVFFILEGGMQLLQGRRALFASTLLFVLWYLLKYYKVKRIKYRYFVGAGIGLLAVIVLFYMVEQRRSGEAFSLLSIFGIVKDLMISTGGSDSVLANTLRNIDKFPNSGTMYLFDSVIHNPVINILTGKMGVNQGYEYLQNFNSFSHWLSYLTEKSLYLSGYGMGSCYLAEVYLALGIFGVIIVSVILAKVISVFAKIDLSDNAFKNSVFFIIIGAMFTWPRDGLFSWFSSFVYLAFVFCIIFPFYSQKKVIRSLE